MAPPDPIPDDPTRDSAIPDSLSQPSPPPRAAPTLADVARRADVSTATVSRCLNAPDKLSAQTRARVMAAVRELGYAPNLNARALVARRSRTIGAIIPTMENAIFAQGLQAFQEELGRHGYTLFVAASFYQEALEAEQIRALVARGADGLLLIGYHRAPALYAYLAERGVPALVSWAYQAERAEPAMGFDNVAAMSDLARHVLGLGHRRIGYVSAPMEANDRARARHAGLRAAIDATPGAALQVIETAYGIETGADALRHLLSQTPQVSCVMCGNDVLAVGALRAAKEMGLDVPRDLSITGFDNIELAAVAEPPLTTVHVPHREMGRRAARMLLGMLEGKGDAGGEAAAVALPTELRLRGSLGPPRA